MQMVTRQPTAAVALAAKLFRAFSDPTRLAIINELSADELRVTDLVDRLRGSQANISGHLACLKDCGLVTDRPQGRQSFYRITTPEVVRLLRAAEDLLAVNGHRVAICPNYQLESS